MEHITMSSFVMGFHDYMEKWTPIIGEVLICVMEPDNAYDKYEVAVKKRWKRLFSNLVVKWIMEVIPYHL